MKSDILDADDEPKVRSVQVDEDVMELESEEEADSALLGEEGYKQLELEAYIQDSLDLQCHIAIGDRYAYRSSLEMELNYGRDAKSMHVAAAGYAFENDDIYGDDTKLGADPTARKMKI
uniref:Uncharacterized protein n=1 Tax=Romanomermis culicivorax TaxID=13658 RepID=A0A915KEV3_ROMCU